MRKNYNEEHDVEKENTISTYDIDKHLWTIGNNLCSKKNAKQNVLNYKYLEEGMTMNYSYVMGTDNINKLKEKGFKIKSYGNNYGVSFSSDKIEMFENFICENLQNGFWNEYLGKEKVFIFKFNDGRIKKYVLSNKNEKEILNLCQEFANCKYESINKMLTNNSYYAETYFKS